MLKNLTFLFTLISLTSCGKSGGSNKSSGGPGAPTSTEVVHAEEISTDSPVPNAALNFEVSLQLINFDGRQEAKVLEAAELIEKVVASEEFKSKILNHKVKGKNTFVDNNGLSNAMIYKKILEGSEKLRPGKDNKMNLELEAFYASNTTVGYTYPHTVRVWINEKFLSQHRPWKVTTNMMHEWLHKLGFGHDKENTPTRKYSVPYAIGYLVADLAKKIR